MYALCDSAMRGVCLHVYYISVSKSIPVTVTGPHGQLSSYAAAFHNPTNMYVDIESWNFVIRSWKSHGILSRRFRGNLEIQLYNHT